MSYVYSPVPLANNNLLVCPESRRTVSSLIGFANAKSYAGEPVVLYQTEAQPLRGRTVPAVMNKLFKLWQNPASIRDGSLYVSIP